MKKFAKIILPLPTDTIFTYRVPDDLIQDIHPGQLVMVPVKRNRMVGLVTELSENSDLPPEIQPESIIDVITPGPMYDQDRIDLLQWMASYYLTPLGTVFAATLTPGLFLRSKSMVTLTDKHSESVQLTENESLVIEALQSRKGKATVSALQKQTGILHIHGILNRLEKKQIIEIARITNRNKPQPATEVFYKLNDTLNEEEGYKKFIRPNAYLQKKVIQFFRENSNQWVRASEITRGLGIPSSTIQTMIQKNILIAKSEDVRISKKWKIAAGKKNIILNHDQQTIINTLVDAIHRQQFFPALIWGVTGSGKTEIYIETARNVLKQGKSVLVLSPEIGLTPQLVGRFEHALQQEVLVYHSRLSEKERFSVWEKAASGDPVLVIGVRSAIFLPLKNPGAIIIDEEHETSFKESDGMPSYHARDLALYIARQKNALFLAGSATPSLESLYLARTGKIHLFELKKRATNQKLPTVSIVNLKDSSSALHDEATISEELLVEIQARLLAREQVLLFKNLRGFSPYICCVECGHVFKCPSCDITMTFHKHQQKILCHYCGHEEFVPQVCPNCRGLQIVRKGEGTEKLEEVIGSVFPEAKIVRIDKDTTTNREQMIQLLQEMKEGNADILIGTKMITKGLDFDRLTLIGVLDADMDFQFPDFRSHERGFQTLVQVIGRSGRGDIRGKAVLQTRQAENALFDLIRKQDYATFVEKEFEHREVLHYPPVSRMILFVLSGKDQKQILTDMQKLVKFLKKYAAVVPFIFHGPVPAPRSRLKNLYRFQMMLRVDRSRDPQFFAFKKILKQFIFESFLKSSRNLHLRIDVDPLDLM